MSWSIAGVTPGVFQAEIQNWLHWECDRNPQECICKGRGWINSEFDTWHECLYHRGLQHPESYEAEADDFRDACDGPMNNDEDWDTSFQDTPIETNIWFRKCYRGEYDPFAD